MNLHRIISMQPWEQWAVFCVTNIAAQDSCTQYGTDVRFLAGSESLCQLPYLLQAPVWRMEYYIKVRPHYL